MTQIDPADLPTGTAVRVPLPLRPDMHYDLTKQTDGWRCADGGPRTPYTDADVRRCGYTLPTPGRSNQEGLRA
ncbi:hypothetical protein GS896_25510 [Rhodococcus hoagii]|nr:hypothetical protein [Prescottella equi]MBM4654136.1 hypothetical protein [Prescottella equi]MBM4719610.1 hypothetical protein [Prescottella equi]NKR23408.1 hypothetical protein [Prescottella equi]NKT55980.1 hypothetical protein [Prescottella equi]